MPTFVVACYISQQCSKFYACLDKDQSFANLEYDIAYFKSKEEFIVINDMDVVQEFLTWCITTFHSTYPKDARGYTNA
mgnify:CR=1 FL=1